MISKSLSNFLLKEWGCVPSLLFDLRPMIFLVVMYGCESWTIMKAECWIIDGFELWCQRRLLRVPWVWDQTSQSKSKSVLNIHWKDRFWNWNPNTLAAWWEELTHWKRPWCWRRLKAGEEGDSRRWDVWMASPIQWTWVWANSGSRWWTGKPGVLQSMESQRVRHDWETEPIEESVWVAMKSGHEVVALAKWGILY